ncbi:replication initiator protein [Microviridae sp.]|nr:replication initiator protein [Microviridae sp.]
MLCSKPYRKGIESFPCGRCTPCLLNRQSVWATRCHLESLLWGDSIFITLTYDDEHLPTTQKAGRRSVQLFLKRWRKLLPQKIRYFIAMEYGKLGRMHFHGIIFNASRFDAESLNAAWENGFTHVGECNEKTINYVTKYITKGDSRVEEETGRKTFALMSRNNGIGYGAIKELARAVEVRPDCAASIAESDVPASVRVNGRKRPVGRYITRKLREQLCSTDGSEPGNARAHRLSETQSECRLLGTRQHLALDQAKRKNSRLSADFAINLKKSKEKL